MKEHIIITKIQVYGEKDELCGIGGDHRCHLMKLMDIHLGGSQQWWLCTHFNKRLNRDAQGNLLRCSECVTASQPA